VLTKTVWGVIAVVAVFAPAAGAVPVTVTFSGALNEARDPRGNLGPIAAGTGFSGSFTYESTTTPVPGVGFPGAVTAGSFTVGGNPFALDLAAGNKVELANNAPLGAIIIDFFQVESVLIPAYGYDDLLFVFTLVDFQPLGAPDALDSNGLPTAFDLADFPQFIIDQFVVTLSGGHAPEDRLRLAGDLTSLAAIANPDGPAPVPEPTTLAAVLTSLMLLAVVGTRRRLSGQH